MSQEQTFDVISLWDTVSFDGKQLFTLYDDGRLLLHADESDKARLIAELNAENGDATIGQLREKFQQLEARVAEIAAEWTATEDKLKLADKVHALRTQLGNTPALGNIDKLIAEVATWEQAVNVILDEHYAAKLKLVEQVEALAQSTDWKETTNAMRDLVEQWKHTGHADKQRSDKLWNRIEAARKDFQEHKRKHFEEQEKDMLHNLDLKLDLVEQAEALAASTEWKKTTETFHRLTNEWKTIGHTLSKKNEELWQRFITAKSAFFDKKREHTGRIQVEQEANYTVKAAIVEKAEALRESTEWNNTTLAFAALMEEWKKTGRVGGEKGDELWNRFTTAQEQFFSAKKLHTEEIRVMHEGNLAKKMALLNRAEEIKNSKHWGDTTAELNELLDEWKKIGPVAREHSNKIWEQFLAARKHFFGRKDANREQRKIHHEMHKAIREEHAREAVTRLLREIEAEEEKMVDFKEALENVTPGKKADELKAHLEKLLADGEQKIKRLREKYAAIQDEYGRKEANANAGDDSDTAGDEDAAEA